MDSRRYLMRAFGVLLLILASWVSPTASAQSVVCNSIYMVQRGDSLTKIAALVYGRMSAYQAIFDYNPGIITNPNSVPVGVGLYIPCIEENEATAPADDLSEPPAAGSSSVHIRILTGSEYPPYVDENLPNGGFSVELVERAMLQSSGNIPFRIDVINDWTAHLVPLLADGAYDLAFPWFQPDCSARDLLGEDSIWRCDNLRFSEPLHEVVVSFHVRPEIADSISTAENMQGMRLCRPRGYFTHDLEAMGLSPDNYTRVAAANPADCFERLAEGEVDIVTVNADTSDRILADLDMQGQSRELIDFATVQTLHVVAMKTDPQARVNLLRLNQGLRALKNSGEYRSIASTHLR